MTIKTANKMNIGSNASADTTAPVFASAKVNGSKLVMTYNEALDATHIPGAGRFAVTVDGVANVVTNVAVNATAKTVILTLSNPVINTDVVMIGYTDPGVSNNINAIQDKAGNDAITIRAQTVINNTPDIIAPVFAGATVNGNTLVMTYTEATTLDAVHTATATAFTVKAGGTLNAVTEVTVDAVAKTVTLTLTAAVNNTDVVTVGYKDPSVKNNVNAIQDLSGNDAVTLHAQTVINNTPDIIAPVFAGATVNGNTLVMTYTEATTLDAVHTAATTAFTVKAGNTLNAVTEVAVDAVAKTVTLTLTTAVDNTDVVTVGYKDSSVKNNVNAIQDLSGNDAVTLHAQTVINNTPDIRVPVFSGATVNGNTLVMTYTEATTLDAIHTPVAGSFAVMAGDALNAVRVVVVDAVAKTVTLTLTAPVTNGAVVTVGYIDPSIGNDTRAIQDMAGNDAITIAAQTVINNTPDTTAPVFASAAVNGNTLVMIYTEATALDAIHTPTVGSFAVMVGNTRNAVTVVTVDAIAKTVTLTLDTAVSNGAVVTVGYTDQSTGNGVNAIQDITGNDATTITHQMVINNTPDTTAPAFAGAMVSGDTLVMAFTGINALDTTHAPVADNFTVTAGGIANIVMAVAVDGIAKTVTLTLATPVVNGAVVTVGYIDPTVGNDINAIQDLAGNDAITIATQMIVNITPDTTASVFAGAAVNGSTMVMTYTGVNALDATHAPAAGNFAIAADGVANAVTAVTVDAIAKTLTLTLANPVSNGAVVTVGYTDPSNGNDINAIQDLAGNDAETITAQTVVNNTPDTTRPVFAGATVNGNTLVMSYTEANALDADHAPVAGNFTVMAGGIANAVTAVVVDVIAETVTLTLVTAVNNGAVVTVGYTDPSTGNDINAIQDKTGNDAITIAAQTVINNTPDTTQPVFAGATVNGNTLVMTYTEANALDADHAPVAGNFTVMAGGIANAVTAVVVDIIAETITLTLVAPVINGAIVTVGYTDPSTGNDVNAIQDLAGNDALTVAAQTVINNTPDTSPPVFAGATVNGNALVMTYTGVNSLDAFHAPVADNFVVAVGGVPNDVLFVSVDVTVKTVTLILNTAVVSGAVVTVGYTDPSTGNDVNAIQDLVGNDAFSLVDQTVINTTLPVFASATINGNTLVMTYNAALDAAHSPVAGSFAVAAGGVANAVTAVAVNAIAKTVTLTLSTPVTNRTAVTVSYTDPSVGNDINAIQDVFGNDALSLVAQTVTNITPPIFTGAAVNGNTLVMTYSASLDATHTAVSTDFAVNVNGNPNTVTSVAVNTATKTVTLTLNIPVVSGNVVTLNYTDPSTGNDVNAIQGLAGNDVLSLIAQPVTNTTAPVFADATVNGNTLVMTYGATLDATHAPVADNFAVAVGGIANAVTAVAVNAAAKTVTLTLTTPVVSGNTVTLGYTDPSTDNDTNAIQDVQGNDALSLVAQTVTNTTAPVFASAAINGNTLVMSYSGVLDAVHTAAATAFAVKVDGNPNVVTSVAVDAVAKTVTLTLTTAVINTAVVTVAYTDPTISNDTNAIQDATGNDVLSLVAQPVTNITAPVFTSAAINGNTLVMTYNEALDANHTAAASAFAVKVNGNADAVTSVTVNAAAKTVTLTLANYVDSGNTVTVAYADPSLGNDVNAIQNAAGYDAVTIAAQAVTNNTPWVEPPDSTAPTVNTISIASATGIAANTLNAGDIVSVTVPFSEAVTVTGTPKLGLVIGSTPVLAVYASGTGTSSLTFTYTILPNQTDANGISIAANTLALNSGTIKDAAGNAAILTHALVADNASYKVDTTAPTAPTAVTLTPQGGTIVVNAVNSTNTHLNIAATVVAGQATGGKAEFYVGADIVGTDSSIASGDTSVTYTTADVDPTNAELQLAISAGGVVTVKLFDAVGNNVTSTASNPTLAVDYTPASIIAFTTVGAEVVAGTTGNDTFTATYGNGLAGTFDGVLDTLDGLSGTDTLNITIGAAATTSLDADWTTISNIEKVVFNSNGDPSTTAAQSITAGTLFNAAFASANVDLTAQTVLGAISIDMSAVVKPATITTTTIGAGAHSILTGSGVGTTVNATALAAGAQTINGIGLTTVNATVNGAGDQTIGTTHGEALISVNATIVGAGFQTITSTSGSDVTVNATATAGVQTIVTAAGNDTVTITGATGQTNTITTNAGNDTIVASLGTDLITGGLGEDKMTSGGATDTFAFGNNGSVIGTSMDVITDFNTAGADVLTFGASTTLLTADATALVVATNVNTTSGGLITFAAADDTLSEKIIAVQADAELDVAGSVAMFVDSGNTYVYYAGIAPGPADDQLIQLTGITTLATITGGATTVFA